MPRKILEFSEIDDLFLEYKKACEIPNNDQFITTQKSKIIEELWRNLKTKTVYARIEEFPDEMVKVTNYCIKIFKEKETHQGFSSYTLSSIQNRLATCSQNMSFDENTNGMHVSDKYRTIHNTLRRLYKSFISLRKSSDFEKEVK